MAVSSPLLEASIEGAHGVLLSIAGGSDLGLFEVSAAANLIEAAAHEDANIIFGTVIDDALGDEVRVTVIAAGFDGGSPPKRTSKFDPKIEPRKPATTVAPVVAEPRVSTSDVTAEVPRQVPEVSFVPIPDDELDIPDFLK